MNSTTGYPIGTPGQPWGAAEKTLWLSKQQTKRDYQQQVVAQLADLASELALIQYGELSYPVGQYDLWLIKSRQWHDDKPTVLITGGVHGYETSGVQGAIRFAKTHAVGYLSCFNMIIAPCVSPWGYATINRWNPDAIDPNRAFIADSPAQESAAIMAYMAQLGGKITVHLDLHETTDTDNSEFRPAVAARDNIFQKNWNIPDGFYAVGDSERPVAEFQRAIIAAVEKVTHIAPADEQGQLIGEPLQQFGVINYDVKKLGLCTGFSDASYSCTTEVYPDSPKVDAENCINAQVAAVQGGLDYVISALNLR